MTEFARCYECGLIYPPADLEGGLCRSCQGEPSRFTFETIGGLVKGRCGSAKVRTDALSVDAHGLSQEDYCFGCMNVGACNVIFPEDWSYTQACPDRVDPKTAEEIDDSLDGRGPDPRDREHDQGPLFAGVLDTDIGPIYSFPPNTGTYGQRKAKRMREAKAAKRAAVDAGVMAKRR